MKGVIYKYTSPTGKSYIGQTINERKRKIQHKSSATNSLDKAYNHAFHRAIRKYGFDSFTYEILWTIIDNDLEKVHNELNKMEVYYIGLYDTFKNGYNNTIGGDGCGSGECHPSYGTKLSEEHKKKLKASRTRKVWKFDLDGNFICEYESAALAAKDVNGNSSGIIKCCKRKHGKVKEYQWRYAGDMCEKYKKNSPTITYSGKESGKSKPTIQYDKDWNIIQKFDGVAVASRELNISLDCLYHVVGKKKLYKNSFWDYEIV